MTELADRSVSADRPAYRMSHRELLTLMSAIMALMALGLDLMLPAFDDIREAFDLGDGSPETAKIITFYFVGMAISQLVYGPMADRFGRKPVLYVGIVIYLIGAIGSAIAPTFGLLLVSRFVWGVGAGGARVVSTAIIRDRFEGTEMARAMSQVMAVFMLVPILAPALGTAIIAILPWQSLFWFCALFALIVTIWSFRMRESLNPADRRELKLGSTVAGYVEVGRTRVTAGYTVSTIFLQGVFTTYLASSELLIAQVFDREAQFPYIFGLVAVLFAVGALVNGRVVGIVGIHRLVNVVFMLVVSLTLVSIVISVTSSGQPNFWLFMPVLALTLGSFMFLMPNLNTAALEPVGHLAGTASALSGAIRTGGGAVLGTIVSSQVSDSTTPFSIGVAVLCICAWVSLLVTRRRSPFLRNPHQGTIVHTSLV